MKKNFLIIIFFASFISFVKAQDTKFPLKVSFISYGSGVDGKALQELDGFLKKHKNLKIEKTAWGREGEIDYCLALDNLSKRKKKKFIKNIKNLLKSYELVRIAENAPCQIRKKQ